MADFLHYHKWDLVLTRCQIARGEFDPFDKIGSDRRMPDGIVGANVWGITKTEGEWFFTGRIVISWSGTREDIPLGVSGTKLQGLSYYATCDESDAMGHGLYPVDIGWIPIPRLGGKTLDELYNIQLSGFLEEIDIEIDFDDWDDVSSKFA